MGATERQPELLSCVHVHDGTMIEAALSTAIQCRLGPINGAILVLNLNAMLPPQRPKDEGTASIEALAQLTGGFIAL
jgi:hypothetical protein